MYIKEKRRKKRNIGAVFFCLLSGFIGSYGGNYVYNFLNPTENISLSPLSYGTINESIPFQTSIEAVSEPSYEMSVSPTTSTLHTASSVASLSIPEIAALNGPSVVEIQTETLQTDYRMRQVISGGAGSGVIVTSDGYIATNHHVIDGASKITVRFQNGESYEATLIGKDNQTDLAVIKVNQTNLQPIVFADSTKIVVGELAVAIGNPLGQLGGSVTEGIISATSREIILDGQSMTLLQTSAAINPGNSGGGLFGSSGELLGIVNAKSSGSDIEGLGFAIPSNTAKNIIWQLIEDGYIKGRPDFGATFVDILDLRSALINQVSSLGVYVANATEVSGLQKRDRIVSIEGIPISSANEIKSILANYAIGDTLSVIVERNNTRIRVSVPLIEKENT